MAALMRLTFLCCYCFSPPTKGALFSPPPGTAPFRFKDAPAAQTTRTSEVCWVYCNKKNCASLNLVFFILQTSRGRWRRSKHESVSRSVDNLLVADLGPSEPVLIKDRASTVQGSLPDLLAAVSICL